MASDEPAEQGEREYRRENQYMQAEKAIGEDEARAEWATLCRRYSESDDEMSEFTREELGIPVEDEDTLDDLLDEAPPSVPDGAGLADGPVVDPWEGEDADTSINAAEIEGEIWANDPSIMARARAQPAEKLLAIIYLPNQTKHCTIRKEKPRHLGGAQ